MRFTNAHKLSPIGIDLGSHSFKAVQLNKSGAGWEVSSAVTLSRVDPGVPLNGSEIARLAGVLDRRGFVGNDVVIAVPVTGLLTTILELPARAGCSDRTNSGHRIRPCP